MQYIIPDLAFLLGKLPRALRLPLGYEAKSPKGLLRALSPWGGNLEGLCYLLYCSLLSAAGGAVDSICLLFGFSGSMSRTTALRV